MYKGSDPTGKWRVFQREDGAWVICDPFGFLRAIAQTGYAALIAFDAWSVEAV